ncbi:alpha/beta hydrolase [Simiduia curdlanivorans]|uniref:Alpha/beta fold hydrolase n=1 Tax=Simiduia curdlanivorans TaxID=1492769 RepID=A0ABV8V458_9GAMM|nr:alpha/beta hydrolase [Simiduia curdlanivorans]MDN3640942.1 alpha/beta hydrolase [Simiduia curdlanivorans]
MPYFMSAGRKLHYVEQGSGEPLVLLHGLGSRADDWQVQMASWGGDYRVIALDLRGHGLSDVAEAGLTIATLADDLLALLNHLQLPRCFLVGFSLGGMVAFEFAVRNPARVSAMVIVNSGPQVAPFSVAIKCVFWLRLLTIRLLGMRALGRQIARRIFPEPEQAQLREKFESQMANNDSVSYRNTLLAIRDWSVSAYLDQLQMPILIVAADQDYTSVAVKEAYAKYLKRAELVVISDSRHATPLDQPEKFNSAVFDFLRKLSGALSLQQ